MRTSAPFPGKRSRIALLMSMLVVLAACEMVETSDREVGPASLERRNFEIDIQPIMRGTIASEAVFVGDSPTIVRGYGLVVGLRGTGSRDMPAPVRAFPAPWRPTT